MATTGAGAPDGRKVGEPARRTIEAVRALAERATALLAAPEALRESVRQQVEILRRAKLAYELGKRPVDELKPLVGKGVRLGALPAGGVRTVADVRERGAAGLTTVSGVGEHTAYEVAAAAKRYADMTAGRIRIRLDPDRRTADGTRLLATLAALRHADAAAGSLREPLGQFVLQTTPLVAHAQRAASRWSMFWSRRATKAGALDALGQLERVLADTRVMALGHTLGSAATAADPAGYGADQLWRDYEADAATYNALLSTLGGSGDTDDSEAAQGFIGPELRQRITAIPLDTSLLRATLRGYQAFGAQYAIHQQQSIIGDEMGLGKTVQALAAVAHLAAKGQRRFLVVCPASVQINWQNEIRKHSRLRPYSLHGRDREAAGREWLRAGGVAVTTFTTLGSLRCLDDAEPALLVVDEAHYVKNPAAKRSETVARVIARSQRTLFLTGTPMENRVEEFRTLVSYLQPRLAGRIDGSGAVAGARAFRRAVAPVYLRRNQKDVLTELPDKIEVEDWVQLTPEDEAAYRAAVAGRNLMGMRQAAYASASSAKLDRLVELAQEAVADGRKVIVFSFFLRVLDRVRERLGDAALEPITGAVPPAVRQDRIDAFTRREGGAVLLSQIEAGGVGLNVQAASVVLLAEPQWKPSTEDQAVARAHRMGQVRTVQVHRILAKGSVDERMREILEGKRLLFDEYARKSDAKDADARAVDTAFHRPEVLDDVSVPLDRRVVIAERARLGLKP